MQIEFIQIECFGRNLWWVITIWIMISTQQHNEQWRFRVRLYVCACASILPRICFRWWPCRCYSVVCAFYQIDHACAVWLPNIKLVSANDFIRSRAAVVSATHSCEKSAVKVPPFRPTSKYWTILKRTDVDRFSRSTHMWRRENRMKKKRRKQPIYTLKNGFGPN